MVRPGTPQNYKLQFEIERGAKVARYTLALNGGSLNTEVLDRLDDNAQPGEQRFIQFNATLTPLSDDDADVLLTISRVRSNKVRTGEREVVQTRSLPLSTKVTLSAGSPLTIFDDQEEKITLLLASLPNALGARDQCIRNLRMIDGAKEQWGLQKKKVAHSEADEAAVNQYIKGGAPRCPAGGVYAYGILSESPVCSLPGHSL